MELGFFEFTTLTLYSIPTVDVNRRITSTGSGRWPLCTLSALYFFAKVQTHRKFPSAIPLRALVLEAKPVRIACGLIDGDGSLILFRPLICFNIASILLISSLHLDNNPFTTPTEPTEAPMPSEWALLVAAALKSFYKLLRSSTS